MPGSINSSLPPQSIPESGGGCNTEARCEGREHAKQDLGVGYTISGPMEVATEVHNVSGLSANDWGRIVGFPQFQLFSAYWVGYRITPWLGIEPDGATLFDHGNVHQRKSITSGLGFRAIITTTARKVGKWILDEVSLTKAPHLTSLDVSIEYV